MGKRMNSGLELIWTKSFVKGHWTKKAPKTPGLYYVGSRDRHVSGTRLIVDYPGKGLRILMSNGTIAKPKKGWKGWWWSAAVPVMPKPPKWSHDKNKASLRLVVSND